MASRRNSESVFHGAVAIAAAVPQLMVHPGNSMSTSNIPGLFCLQILVFFCLPHDEQLFVYFFFLFHASLARGANKILIYNSPSFS